jgi:iron(III) transport system substrate-binding protein
MKRTLITAAAAIATAFGGALAQAAEVNVYTTRQPELIQPIFDAFTKETGIEVNVLYAEKGLIERMKAEGARSPADLFMTVDISNIKAATDEGLTQPHNNASVNDIVPAEFRDEAGHWFALTTRVRVAYASKERVAEGEVTTYEDLADPKWKGRICTRPGSHPYNLALISAVIAHHGPEAAREWTAALRDNLARKPQGNDRAQVKAVWAGECDIAIGNTYYMGQMLADPEQKEWADSVRIVFPTFAEGGAHMNISGAVLTRSAPNPEEAQKLIDFLLTPAAQQLYAELNHEYPVRPGVERSELVQSWGEFTPDTIPLTEIGSLRSEALKIVEETQYDLGPAS